MYGCLATLLSKDAMKAFKGYDDCEAVIFFLQRKYYRGLKFTMKYLYCDQTELKKVKFS